MVGAGLALGAASPVSAATAPEQATAALAGIRAQFDIPALGAAAARDGRVLWSATLGASELELGAPAAATNRFRLGSVSKIFTSTLAVRLAEKHRIDFQAPISTYRPDLPAALRPLTLAQLLSHTAGVRHYIPRDFDVAAPGGPIDSRVYNTTAEMLAVFDADPLRQAPGESYYYSTFGYSLVGAVLESVTNRPFAELVRTELAAPLGLTSLEVDDAFNLRPGRVRPYVPMEAMRDRVQGLNGKIIHAPAVNTAYKQPGGGMICTAGDVARFGAALLGPGYLSPRSRDLLFTPIVGPAATKAPFSVAFGWRVDTDARGRRRYHHAGSIEGGRSGLVLYPDHGVALSMTSNLSGAPGDPVVALAPIAELFLA
ncbi:MAG: hypothetical protein BGN86_03960 [Caulobacterales bacterium 68-7]|nr:MAG: hypothetical protein BGN86_03960 [Caulobacterales bacterium 68-7]